ncbi:MAG TPA: nuclear transport factor 2 family protein [Polyangiaceae bacterium]|nr:nuclear transport factor 2 family protein [Polyangiaceae bacterium]
MPVLDSATVGAFAAEWIAAWNARDVDRVLEHYAEDVRFSSPLVASIAGEPTGSLTGKPALRAYWSKALASLPELRFTLVDVLAGVNTVTLYYRGHRGTVAETFHFDEAGRVRAANACYGLASAL